MQGTNHFGFLYLWSLNSRSNWIPWTKGKTIIYCRYNNAYKKIKFLHAIYKLAWYTIEESISYGKYTLIVSPFYNKVYTHIMNQSHTVSVNLSPSFVVQFKKRRYFFTKFIHSEGLPLLSSFIGFLLCLLSFSREDERSWVWDILPGDSCGGSLRYRRVAYLASLRRFHCLCRSHLLSSFGMRWWHH